MSTNAAARLRAKLKEKLAKYKPQRYFAIGLLGDGKGNVSTGAGDWCYVRVDGAVVKALNQRTAHTDDLPVVVGYDEYNPNTLQVLSVYLANNDGGTDAQMTLHHATHEFLSAAGGNDVVWVQLRQFMPGRVTFDGMTASVTRYAVYTGGVWQYVTGTLDLSGYVPVSNALWAVIYWEGSALGVAIGTAQVKANLTLQDFPDLHPSAIPLCAVRLYAGQTAVSETLLDNDVLDVRFAQQALRKSLALEPVSCWGSSAPEVVFDRAGNVVCARVYVEA